MRNIEVHEAQSLESLGFEKNQIVNIKNHNILSGYKMQLVKGSAKIGAVVGRLCNQNTYFGDLLVTIDAVCLESI